MQRLRPKKTVHALITALWAAAVVVSYPAIGDCATASKLGDCCRWSEEVIAGGLDCCQKAKSTDIDAASPSISTCGIGRCLCGWPANPQNIPLIRSTDRIQPDYAVTFAAIVWSSADADAGKQSFAVSATNLVAIPHRILHCSWLI